MPDLLADGSLPGRWTRRWRERGSWPQLRDIDDRWLTSDELEAGSRVIAGRLRAAGLDPGDRFVICAPSSASLVLAYIGALRAGLVVVPLNTAYTREEVARIISDARPRGAAIAGDEPADWIRETADDAELVLTGIDIALPDGADPADLDAAAAADPALLIYTSGTTGRPKGARLTHGNLLASATAVEQAWQWTPEDRLLLTLPLFHVHGLGVGLNGALCTGSSLELRPRFDLDDVLGRAAGGDISMFFGVPTMYGRLAGDDRAGALRALRLLVSGSAPLAPSVADAIAAAAGQVPLERYGMTETVMLTTNPLDPAARRTGTVGFPFPSVELRLGEGGEIQVRGPNVITEYWERPEATAEAVSADGWFRTGDLGALDADGYLSIIGRSKELIISGGFNVYPREVEERLLTHPAVAEVAVIGRPSDEWGEEVTAVIVLSSASSRPDPDELRAHAAGALVGYKVPRRWEFVDGLPRNALGKLVRAEI